jgi:basic amino acid/polyamine antiporter, APA family
VALVFSVLFIVYSRNTGEDTPLGEYLPFVFAGVAFLLGIPVYLAQRARMTEPPPVPEYRP